MFLMPSRFEPCGLSQLYSLRYGTVPIVRADRRLGRYDHRRQRSDTRNQTATGFAFDEYPPVALADAIKRALDLYTDQSAWQKTGRDGHAPRLVLGPQCPRLSRCLCGNAGESAAGTGRAVNQFLTDASPRPRDSAPLEPRPPGGGVPGLRKKLCAFSCSRARNSHDTGIGFAYSES